MCICVEVCSYFVIQQQNLLPLKAVYSHVISGTNIFSLQTEITTFLYNQTVFMVLIDPGNCSNNWTSKKYKLKPPVLFREFYFHFVHTIQN